jgi:hypothetical protein
LYLAIFRKRGSLQKEAEDRLLTRAAQQRKRQGRDPLIEELSERFKPEPLAQEHWDSLIGPGGTRN